MGELLAAIFWGLLPTLVVLGIFVMILRGVLRFDRNERREYNRIEQQERERRGLPPRAS